MGKGPDLAACLGVLEDHEREAVETLADSLGLADWTACGPLRRVVVTVAALRMSADVPGLSASARLRQSCYALGAGSSSTRLATSIDRQLLRWQLAAADEMVRHRTDNLSAPTMG